VQALAGEKRAWESVTGRGKYTACQTLHWQDSKRKAEKAFQGPLKREDEAFKGL
jgi:hypothetical protein